MQTNIQNVSYSKRVSEPVALTVQIAAADFSTDLCTLPHALWHTGDIIADAVAYNGAVMNLDLTQQISGKNVTELQSVFIDNSINPGLVILYNIATGQRLQCSAFSQGSYLIFTQPGTNSMQWVVLTADYIHGNPAWGEISTPQTAVPLGALGYTPREAFITLIFTNVAAPVGQWGLDQIGYRVWDVSETIVTGGTFQSMNAVIGGVNVGIFATAYRRGYVIHNPVFATEPLYVDKHQSTTAGIVAPTVNNTIGLFPGETLEEKGKDAFFGSIRVMAATTGHVYVAKVYW